MQVEKSVTMICKNNHLFINPLSRHTLIAVMLFTFLLSSETWVYLV